jgi:hypothetical protein
VRSRPMQVIVSDQRMPGMRWTTCAASRPPRCGCC